MTFWYVMAVIGTVLYAVVIFLILCEYAWLFFSKAATLVRIQLCPKHRGRWLPKTPPVNHHPGPAGYSAHGGSCDCGHHHEHEKEPHHSGSCCH